MNEVHHTVYAMEMTMSTPLFVLLTDFGFDFAVASMKGVIARSLPHADIIDLDHTIEKFNLISAAFVLHKSYRFFPKGTTFVCVIDPGVGSERKLLCIETEEYTFVAPDNGLLHHILRHETLRGVWYVDDHGMKPQSNTFHGRDLFVPVAIALAQGQRDFLRAIAPSECIVLDQLDTKQLVVYTDSFGNIKTNVSADLISGHKATLTVHGTTHRIPYTQRFSECAPGELLCYRGSNDTLEIAVNLGSARDRLGVTAGDEIEIS